MTPQFVEFWTGASGTLAAGMDGAGDLAGRMGVCQFACEGAFEAGRRRGLLDAQARALAFSGDYHSGLRHALTLIHQDLEDKPPVVADK